MFLNRNHFDEEDEMKNENENGIDLDNQQSSINYLNFNLASKEDVSPVLVRKNSRPNFLPRSISRLSRLMLT